MTDTRKLPFVFRKCLLNWKTFQRWSPEYIAQSTTHEKVKFKIGKKTQTRHNMDNHYDIEINESFQNFIDWCKGVGKNKFSEFDNHDDWAYCSYEYVNTLFKSLPELIDEIDWTFFGFPEEMKTHSVFWMGSIGSFTPCHFDTYGCNLICQLRGNKKWLLFPPGDTKYLYPTRIPYEESSVFSSIDFNNIDIDRFPLIRKTSPFQVTLTAGDALFVPRHWWHFVKTIDVNTADVENLNDNNEDEYDESVCSLSINVWLDDIAFDNKNRINESLVKLATYSFFDSSLLQTVPHGAIINRDEFLDNEWGINTIERLNEMLSFPLGMPCEHPDLLEGVFDRFGDTGEFLNQMDSEVLFPRTGSDIQQQSIRKMTAEDIIDCFTHPDVISAARNVLMIKVAASMFNEDSEEI